MKKDIIPHLIWMVIAAVLFHLYLQKPKVITKYSNGTVEFYGLTKIEADSVVLNNTSLITKGEGSETIFTGNVIVSKGAIPFVVQDGGSLKADFDYLEGGVLINN